MDATFFPYTTHSQGTRVKVTVRRSKPRYCRISADLQDVAGVLAFSAFPFLAVKAIANSSLGEYFQKHLESTKSEAQANSVKAKQNQVEARELSTWYGPERPKWLGPIPFGYPQHLLGELSGDYGFDPLSLAVEPPNLAKFYNYEVLHGRWAMLGAMGVVVPELLVRFGGAGADFPEPVWWKVGYAKLQGDTLDYLGIPGLHIAGAQGVLIIAVSQFLLMLGPEYARFTGIEALEPLGIYLPGDINYPGGTLFDPLGLSQDPQAFEELKVKEIKNGRLAMVAWVGFAAQAIATKKGPIENMCEILAKLS